MRAFAELYAALDETTKTSEKVEAMVRYFQHAQAADAAWAVYFLTGRKPRQVIPVKHLRAWAAAEAGIDEWLFGESYDAVGDLAETIALVLPPVRERSDDPLSVEVERLLALRDAGETVQREATLAAWRRMDEQQRFVWNKLTSGALRVGVSQQLVMRALGVVFGIETATVAQRLMGHWQPTEEFYASIGATSGEADASRPYPFFLAHALEGELEALGEARDWLLEWKWDGIRAQVIRRGGKTFIWTRGEELVTERYPEVEAVGDRLPEGTVLDGELLPYRDGSVLPFAQLQRRIGRKSLGAKILAEVPVVLVAFDVLEEAGSDLRSEELEKRRSRLLAICDAVAMKSRLMVSSSVDSQSWDDARRAWGESRARGAEGLMLKRRDSAYGVGRVRGPWWKWKVEPYRVDAVLTAARRGSGKRASLYTDYTFSVWNDERKLVPIAQAYSGLTDEEIRRVDAFIRRNMVEKFGPVRTVRPELVFELAFEGLQRSSRHRSGVAVRFPRIARWREDKIAADADTLATIQAMLGAHVEPRRGSAEVFRQGELTTGEEPE